MRAKGSIPAWVKLLAISAGVVAVVALLVAAPWRSVHDPCAALFDNIERVESGRDFRRVSDAFVFEQGDMAAVRVSSTEGDFSGALTLDGVRNCLGADWNETHAAAQAQSYGDAWVFSRAGAPLVMYVQGRSERYRRVEMRIIIERAQ